MKYHSVDAFEKHIKEAHPHHFSSTYAIVCPSDFERKSILDKVQIAICQKESSSQAVSFSTQTPMAEILQQLCTKSLFHACTVVTIDNIEKWTKPDLEDVASYLSKPSSFSHLLLGSSSSKNVNELYSKAKKEMVILDLSDEKPWDREKRLVLWLQKKAHEEKKQLSVQAAQFLLQQYGTDMATLSQELDKIFCFIGEKASIQMEGLLPIISASTLSLNGWQLAEKAIWERGHFSSLPSNDLSFFISLLGQLRYHLQLGMQITSYQEKGIHGSECAAFFPTLKTATFERYYRCAQSTKRSYFSEGLLLLYSVEKTLKSSSMDPEILWESFVAKLHSLYHHGANT